MFCENCGSTMEEDAKFCIECGCATDAGRDAPAAPPEPQAWQQPQYQQPQYQQPTYAQPQQGYGYAPPKTGGKNPIVWIIAGAAAVLLIVAGIIFIPRLIGGGEGDGEGDIVIESPLIREEEPVTPDVPTDTPPPPPESDPLLYPDLSVILPSVLRDADASMTVDRLIEMSGYEDFYYSG